MVQDTLAGEGTQALRMGPRDALAASAVAWSPRTEAAGGARAVTSLLVRHDSFSEASPVIPREELSAVLFINDSGLLALDGDGRGKGSWKLLHPLTPGTFHKVVVIRDYAAQSFQVELDGKQVGDDLGFKDPLTGSPLLATCETSGEIWLDHLSTTFRSDQTPPSPNPAGWEVPPAPGTPTGEVKDALAIPHLVAANDGSGTDTFTFDPALTLDERESYALTILAEERGSGANVGLASLRIRRRYAAVVDPDHSVRMVAREARDLSGVDYYFECLSGGGHDSGWQSSPEYVDTGLSPGTRYQYRTRSRDGSSSQNLSAWSPPAAATTTGDPPSGSFAAWIASFGLDPGDGMTVAISADSLGKLSMVTVIASQRRPGLYFRVAVVQD